MSNVQCSRRTDPARCWRGSLGHWKSDIPPLNILLLGLGREGLSRDHAVDPPLIPAAGRPELRAETHSHRIAPARADRPDGPAAVPAPPLHAAVSRHAAAG